MARPKKNPFENVDPTFKDAVEAASDTEINTKIAELAKFIEANATLRQEDNDLAMAKEQYDTLNAPYTEAHKTARLKIRYAYDVLKGRGKQ